jgi:hypothetical protein
VSKVEKYKYIYEYDLKGCFDNLSVRYITRILNNLGAPRMFTISLESINRCAVTLPEEILLEEKTAFDKMYTNDLFKRFGILKDPDMFNQIAEEEEFVDFDEMTKEEQEETMKIANELGFNSIEELTTPY